MEKEGFSLFVSAGKVNGHISENVVRFFHPRRHEHREMT